MLGLLHDAFDKSVDIYEHNWIDNDLALVDNRLEGNDEPQLIDAR